MRRRLSMISLLGMVAVCSASAQTPLAERPIRPATGEVKPASSGSADDAGRGSSRAASPEEASAALQQEEQERRATESKRKMKRRPGFQDEVPAPRV
jgi:hypothetical protein